jgi:sterol desaturase/sphingolipid hydroxylase (fatty acid hydroxylase superfamily)
MPNDGLQLRRAMTIQAKGIKLLEKHAIAPSAARLCWIASLITVAIHHQTHHAKDEIRIDQFRGTGTRNYASCPFVLRL